MTDPDRISDGTRELDETRKLDEVGDLDEKLETVGGSDVPSGFRFDCEFCDETFRTATAAEIKERGVAHLEADHRADLATVFARRAGGDDCRNGCGYAFPAAVEDVAGFDCPECGHDHFPGFVRRYLYWEIEAAG